MSGVKVEVVSGEVADGMVTMDNGLGRLCFAEHF